MKGATENVTEHSMSSDRELLWLPNTNFVYRGKAVRFAFHPAMGTYEECYRTINSDPGIVPAEGLDLALLTRAAFTQNDPAWSRVREECFEAGYVRAPARVLWIPQHHELAGAVVTRDINGSDVVPMDTPENISDWERNDAGVYVSPDGNQNWVPRERYTLVEDTLPKPINERDGLLNAYFGQEGAEVLVRASRDSGIDVYGWGVWIQSISEPCMGVVAMKRSRSFGLEVCGCLWNDNLAYAFGKAK